MRHYPRIALNTPKPGKAQKVWGGRKCDENDANHAKYMGTELLWFDSSKFSMVAYNAATVCSTS